MVYGRSGTGKTTFGATFPGKILWIVCSNTKNPGELRSVDTPENRKKIDMVVVSNYEEMMEVVNWLAEGGHPYKTVIVDHITALQDVILKSVLVEEGLMEEGDMIPEQKNWGTARIQDYGQMSQQAKEVIRTLLNYEGNTLLIAQEREFNTETELDGILPYVGASMTPSMTGWCNTVVEYICQTLIRKEVRVEEKKVRGKTRTKKVETGRMEYCMRTGPSEVFITKFRVPGGVKKDMIVDPTYDKLMELISG